MIEGTGRSLAVVIGATGGIGAALVATLRSANGHADVRGYGRSTEPALELRSETSIRACAADIAKSGLDLRLVIDATGVLAVGGASPEKSLKQIDADAMAEAFAINATGPAFLMKHLLPLYPRAGRSVFATLSARVGSIGDNTLGGWYGYRASKAALNQLLRCAAIESARSRPDLICIALHPGTVDTNLSRDFAKDGLAVHTPEDAARNLLGVVANLQRGDNGSFLDWQGKSIPW